MQLNHNNTSNVKVLPCYLFIALLACSFFIELFLSISFDPGLPFQTKKNSSSGFPYISTKLVFVKHMNLTFCPWCEPVPWEDLVHGTFLAFKTPGISKCGKYQFK